MDNECILVIDDELATAKLNQRVLERAGYRVLVAADGACALEIMDQTRPDLILSDINMPHMDGYDLFKAVRARQEWVSIPFIFLSGRGSTEEILKGKAMGSEDYLVKPYRAEELLVAVRARLQRAQAIHRASSEQFNVLKQQIVTVLSHELRTPVFYMTGFAELGLRQLRDQGPGDLEGMLQGIKDGADRLARLVQDLLLVVRLDAGETKETLRTDGSLRRDLDTIVSQVVRCYEPQAAARGVALYCSAPALPPVFLSEPLFMDALGRIVDNAIKFSLRETKYVNVCAGVLGSWVVVEVSDQGVGIPAAEMSHLFERFHQIGRDKMEQQGIGMGLAIARDLIRLHGGDIDATSEFGRGSTFKIRIPVAEDELPACR